MAFSIGSGAVRRIMRPKPSQSDGERAGFRPHDERTGESGVRENPTPERAALAELLAKLIQITTIVVTRFPIFLLQTHPVLMDQRACGKPTCCIFSAPQHRIRAAETQAEPSKTRIRKPA